MCLTEVTDAPKLQLPYGLSVVRSTAGQQPKHIFSSALEIPLPIAYLSLSAFQIFSFSAFQRFSVSEFSSLTPNFGLASPITAARLYAIFAEDEHFQQHGDDKEGRYH